MNNRNNESDAFKQAIRKKVGEETPIASERDAAILENLLSEIATEKQIPLKNTNTPWYAIAAGVALVVSLGVGIYLINPANKEVVEHQELSTPQPVTESIPDQQLVEENRNLDSEKITQKEQGLATETAPEAPKTTEIVAGSRQLQHLLPDESVATLNESASIEINEDFIHHRTVSVKGEVYFEVKSDKTHPFTVYFGNYQLEVVGTAFNVRNMLDEKFKEITVKNGIVRVFDGKTKEGILLKENQQLRIYEQEETVLSVVDASNYIAWKTGSLSFKKTRLEEVFLLLDRQFNEEIILAPEIKNCTFTGDLTGLSGEEALSYVTLTTSLKTNLSEKTVYITGNSCD